MQDHLGSSGTGAEMMGSLGRILWHHEVDDDRPVIAEASRLGRVPDPGARPQPERLLVEEDVVILEAVANRGWLVALPLPPIGLTLNSAHWEHLVKFPLRLDPVPEFAVAVGGPGSSRRPCGIQISTCDEAALKVLNKRAHRLCERGDYAPGNDPCVHARNRQGTDMGKLGIHQED